MIYIYDGGTLSVTEEKKKKKDFYSSSIRLGLKPYINFESWILNDISEWKMFQEIMHYVLRILSLRWTQV